MIVQTGFVSGMERGTCLMRLPPTTCFACSCFLAASKGLPYNILRSLQAPSDSQLKGIAAALLMEHASLLHGPLSLSDRERALIRICSALQVSKVEMPEGMPDFRPPAHTRPW